MLIVTSKFTYADQPTPKFKSYVELQQERIAAADAAHARHKAEQDIADIKAADIAKARADAKAHQKEVREKIMIAAAGATKINVSNVSVAAARGF